MGIANGFSPPEDPRDTAGVGPDRLLKTYGLAAQIDWDLDDNLKLTSLSSYRAVDHTIITNNDGLPSRYSNATQIDDGRQFSLEIRLLGDFDKLQLIVGGYYFHEKAEAVLEVNMSGFIFGLDMEAIFGVPPETWIQGYWAGGDVKTDATALFGQASYELSPGLKLTVGGRYSHEKKTVDEQAQFDFTRVYDPNNPIIPFGTQMDSDTASSFDPKIALEYKFSDNVFAYASWSKGFKSGGYNVGGLQAPFRPEEITDYELGIKTDLLDNRLRINLSGFWYDYKDLQVSVIRNTALLTENAATAELKGIELEFAAAPSPQLRLSGSFSYLDGKYKNYITENPTRPGEPAQNLAGNRLSYSPRYIADGEIAYTVPVGDDDLTLSTRAKYSSKVYFTQFNNDRMSEDGQVVVDAFLDYEFNDAGLKIGAFVKNLFDEQYFVTALEGPFWIGFPRDVVYNPPRTFGIEVRKTF
nr:TonB-dependent receptor [Novosphingobium marinum]